MSTTSTEQSLSPELRARNLRTVLLLAALFFVPLAASFVIYYGSSWRPAGATNHGELIAPARSLPQLALPLAGGGTSDPALLTGKWTLVYVGDGRCDQACRDALWVMRQTRLALNNEMTRVQRVFLATESCCSGAFFRSEHPGLAVLDASGEEARALLAPFADASDRAHSLFIVDPLGNLMMRFDTRESPKGLLGDLKKLLKLSHIG